LFSASLQLCAQDRIPDDSSKYRFLPTGIRVGTDLLAIGKTYYTDYFKGWEVNVDADVYRRYYVAADYGSWTVKYPTDNGVYGSGGKYFRVGVDINFLLKDPDRTMFFIGFRRAHSTYSDYSDYSFIDPVFGKLYMSVTNPAAKANWSELTTGIRIKIWKFIWLGATGRMKFNMRGKDQDALKSYEVPGYGRTFKTSWWGINYQLFVRIPVREDPKPRVTTN
jgi:hypothetical protein